MAQQHQPVKGKKENNTTLTTTTDIGCIESNSICSGDFIITPLQTLYNWCLTTYTSYQHLSAHIPMDTTGDSNNNDSNTNEKDKALNILVVSSPFTNLVCF